MKSKNSTVTIYKQCNYPLYCLHMFFEESKLEKLSTESYVTVQLYSRFKLLSGEEATLYNTKRLVDYHIYTSSRSNVIMSSL